MDVSQARPILSPVGPLALHGPTGALPPPVEITNESDPLPPTLPGNVDSSPTSSIGSTDE